MPRVPGGPVARELNGPVAASSFPPMNRTSGLVFLASLLAAGCSSPSSAPAAPAPTFVAKIGGTPFTPTTKLVIQSSFGPVKYAFLLDSAMTCAQLLDKNLVLGGRWARVPIFWEQTVSKIDNNTTFGGGSSSEITGDSGTVTLTKSVAAGETAHLVFDAHSATDQESLVGPLDATVCN